MNQQQIKASHHKKVKPREFQVGDLVLKRVIQSTKEKNTGKLGPNWEGPYSVMARGGNGSTPWLSKTRGQSVNNGNSIIETLLCVTHIHVQ